MITDSYGGFLLKWLPLHKSSMFFLGFSIKKNHPAEIPHDYGTPRRFTRPRCQLVHGFHKTTETSGPGVWPPGLGKNMVDSTTKTSGDLQHEKWWWSNQPNCGDRMCYIYIYICLVGGFNHLEKYESRWEGLSHILWETHAWNHQPDIIIHIFNIYIYYYR